MDKGGDDVATQYLRKVEDILSQSSLDYLYHYFQIDPKDIPYSVMKEGLRVELEHGTIFALTDITGDNVVMTAKIVLAHLHEGVEYYDKLAGVEKWLEEHGRIPKYFSSSVK